MLPAGGPAPPSTSGPLSYPPFWMTDAYNSAAAASAAASEAACADRRLSISAPPSSDRAVIERIATRQMATATTTLPARRARARVRIMGASSVVDRHDGGARHRDRPEHPGV